MVEEVAPLSARMATHMATHIRMATYIGSVSTNEIGEISQVGGVGFLGLGGCGPLGEGADLGLVVGDGCGAGRWLGMSWCLSWVLSNVP
jgi:hypothetical protein